MDVWDRLEEGEEKIKKFFSSFSKKRKSRLYRLSKWFRKRRNRQLVAGVTIGAVILFLTGLGITSSGVLDGLNPFSQKSDPSNIFEPSGLENNLAVSPEEPDMEDSGLPESDGLIPEEVDPWALDSTWEGDDETDETEAEAEETIDPSQTNSPSATAIPTAATAVQQALTRIPVTPTRNAGNSGGGGAVNAPRPMPTATPVPAPTAAPTPVPTTAANRPIAQFSATLSSYALNVGGSARVSATNISPSNTTTKSFEYSSSRPDVATVDGAGNIKALKTGDTVITVTAGDSRRAKATVTLAVIQETAPAVNDFQVRVDTTTLQEGQTVKIQISDVSPAGADAKFMYSSSADSIASVNSSGVITAKNVGTVEITITATGTATPVEKKITIRVNAKTAAPAPTAGGPTRPPRG